MSRASRGKQFIPLGSGNSIQGSQSPADVPVWDPNTQKWIAAQSEMQARGFKAWTAPPWGQSTLQPASGSAFVSKVWLPYDVTIQGVTCIVSTAGATLTSNECLLTLYAEDGTKLADTASQHTNWATANIWGADFSGGPYDLEGGYGRYCWVGNLAVGTTSPTFRVIGGVTQIANVGPGAGSANFLSGAELMAGRIATGQTATDDFDPSSLATTLAGLYWFGLY